MGIAIPNSSPTSGNQNGAVITKKTIAASSRMKAVSPSGTIRNRDLTENLCVTPKGATQGARPNYIS